jgi:hypothetical protein
MKICLKLKLELPQSKRKICRVAKEIEEVAHNVLNKIPGGLI